MSGLPHYLDVSADDLGNGTGVVVRRVADVPSLAEEMAEEMLACCREALEQGRSPTLIVPVGPVDQYPVLARHINDARIDLRSACFIKMDEYLTDGDEWVPDKHPLSFRGFMNRAFYDLVDPQLAPRIENRVFPDPGEPEAIERLIEQRGGVDATFGGIGINGHIAFNEPPEPDEPCDAAEFVCRPTRVLDLARETRTINSVTVGGEISVVPRRCITVGMREIFASRKLRFYCNRPWQSAVVRRVLHGPITPACPASFLRTHSDTVITITEQVASRPDIRLR